MYWKLFVEELDRLFSKGRRRGLLRTGAVVGSLLGVAGLLLANSDKGRGSYTRLTDALVAPEHEEAQLRPGGKEPVVLSRSALGTGPEFLSVTLLPGRGMDVLQITANLPGMGEVKLLAAGNETDRSAAMAGRGEVGAGGENPVPGGAFLLPWAGRFGGTAGLDGKSVAFAWHGRTYHLPVGAVTSGMPWAYGGLLQRQESSSVEVNPMPDGGAVSATLASGEMGGSWPSQTRTKISALLGSRALELSVQVKNTGEEAMPVGVGWAPRFVIPSGQRERARLKVPASEREVTAQGSGGMPTGQMEAVKGTAYDFDLPGGAELGGHGLDDTFAHLAASVGAHPAIELRDPAAGVGLQISVLSPTIKAVHVFSPANSGFVSICPQMNYDDPLGGEWKMSDDTGLVVLQPGQMVEWKVRVELFAVLSSLPAKRE